jgi:hypothetical protein
MLNLISVTHHWPGITPLNVWDLTYEVWLLYVAAAKEIADNPQIGW